MHRITIEYGAPAAAEPFAQHYAEVHVPLAAQLPGLRRFTTSHPRGLGTDAPYFVAELWFDDGDALKAALRFPRDGRDSSGRADVRRRVDDDVQR